MATHVQFEVEVKDVEYQQLAGQSWLARVYQPNGPGPFPTIVDVHGGAWNNGDRLNDTAMNQALAASGILTVAIDFRQPHEAGYPLAQGQRRRVRRHLESGRAGHLQRWTPRAAGRHASDGCTVLAAAI